MEDEKRPQPEIERRREWQHGNGGWGDKCGKQVIHTAPQRVPDPCRGFGCDNDEWFSRGVVERERGSKKILTRNGKKVD